jgi:hypothetical protein
VLFRTLRQNSSFSPSCEVVPFRTSTSSGFFPQPVKPGSMPSGVQGPSTHVVGTPPLLAPYRLVWADGTCGAADAGGRYVLTHGLPGPQVRGTLGHPSGSARGNGACDGGIGVEILLEK